MKLAKFFGHDFNSDGWFSVYDINGNEIYHENSNGYWEKKEFDINGNKVYHENSDGKIVDNRISCADKVIEIDGKKYKLTEV